MHTYKNIYAHTNFQVGCKCVLSASPIFATDFEFGKTNYTLGVETTTLFSQCMPGKDSQNGILTRFVNFSQPKPSLKKVFSPCD